MLYRINWLYNQHFVGQTPITGSAWRIASSPEEAAQMVKDDFDINPPTKPFAASRLQLVVAEVKGDSPRQLWFKTKWTYQKSLLVALTGEIFNPGRDEADAERSSLSALRAHPPVKPFEEIRLSWVTTPMKYWTGKTMTTYTYGTIIRGGSFVALPGGWRKSDMEHPDFPEGLIEYNYPLSVKDVKRLNLALVFPLPPLPLYPEGTEVVNLFSGLIETIEFDNGQFYVGKVNLPSQNLNWRTIHSWMQYVPQFDPPVTLPQRGAHTPEPWGYETFEPGDSSVGAPPVPTKLFATVSPSAETVDIATLHDPIVRLDREHWTLEDWKLHALVLENAHDASYSDYPPGVHEIGSADANAERIVACVNFCAEFSNDWLAKNKSLGDVWRGLNTPG